jgi:hypothetical protein
MAGGGSLNDYEALTASLGGQDAPDSDFDIAEDQKRKAQLQVFSRVAEGQFSKAEGIEIMAMLGLLPHQNGGPSLAPSKTFNPTMDAKGN